MKDTVKDTTIRGLAALIKSVKSEQAPKIARYICSRLLKDANRNDYLDDLVD